ncbi:MAG: hypothetical protein Tsb0020_14560 [Haliangiales bacterium]
MLALCCPALVHADDDNSAANQPNPVPSGPLYSVSPIQARPVLCTGKNVQLPFDEVGAALEFPVREGVATTIYVPADEIRDIGLFPHPHIAVTRRKSSIVIHPKSSAIPGMRASIEIYGRLGQHMSLFPVVVNQSTPTPSVVHLVPRSKLEAQQARITHEAQLRVTEALTRRDRADAEQRAKEAEEARFRLAEQLLGTTDLRAKHVNVVPTRSAFSKDLWHQRSASAAIRRITSYTEGDKEIRHVLFVVSNSPLDALRLAELRFRSKSGDMVPAQIVRFAKPDAQHVGFPLQLAAGEEVFGIARVPDEADIPNQGMTISIDGPTLVSPLVAKANQLASLDTFEEEYQRILERERQERERKRLQEEREARGRQAFVTAVARGGAYFIGVAHDENGTVQFDATTTWAAGGRVTKGLAEPLAFEAEIVGGSISSGEFDDVERDGEIGDITRSASFGRIGIGILLRLGDIVIPYAHVGTGVQVASYTSTFTSGGVAAEGPGDGFELAGFVTAGGGIDYRLGGGNFMIGARAAFAAMQGGERALDIGVQLGVGL